MDLKACEFGEIAVVSVNASRIDASSVIRFKDLVRECTPSSAQRVVLDLDLVEFVDSSGLGAIVSVMKLLAPDKTLELSGMGATVAKVFSLTRIDQVFKIHESVTDAVPDFERP